MKKDRIPISVELSADVLYQADRTCCVCNERGKAIQIHHIDEDPSNNDIENLAVLCLQCHEETQIRGGFGRKLGPQVVTKYRDEWCRRVKQRREEVDRQTIANLVEVGGSQASNEMKETGNRDDDILMFVNSLPAWRNAALPKYQAEWDTGITSRVVQANYDYIDEMQGLLIKMADFYPEDTFGEDPHKFFSEQIASRFRWHRAYSEPHGPGTGGSIVNVTVGGAVVEDVEKMIENMALAVVGYDERFHWREWSFLWKGLPITAIPRT